MYMFVRVFNYYVSLLLQVQGVGVTNPFRLRPLLGARIPLNATYSPQITMYNPFSEPLQVRGHGIISTPLCK